MSKQEAMMWLDEIEEDIKRHWEIIPSHKGDMRMMARVLRELAKELREQYRYIDKALADLPVNTYNAEISLKTAYGRRGKINLSDDAKELLNVVG